MNILLIHHLEEIWEDGLTLNGTSFESEVEKILDHINASNYDKVILSRFEEGELGGEHYGYGLDIHIDSVEVYGYGWERAEMEEQRPDEENISWSDGGTHSEVVLLDNWIKDLRGHDVTLVGAFEGECIDDIETAMGALQVNHKRVPGLIVGDGINYWTYKKSIKINQTKTSPTIS